MGRKTVAGVVSVILGIARGILTLGVVLTVVVVALVPYAREPLEVDAAWFTLGTRSSLRFPATKGSFLYINGAFLLSLFVIAIWGLEQLHMVFGTLRKGKPFIDANASRLRRVAAAIVAGEVPRASMVAFNQFYAKAHFASQGLLFDWSFNINFLAVVLALIILAIAEVFAAGTRLDEDQALTI